VEESCDAVDNLPKVQIRAGRKPARSRPCAKERSPLRRSALIILSASQMPPPLPPGGQCYHKPSIIRTHMLTLKVQKRVLPQNHNLLDHFHSFSFSLLRRSACSLSYGDDLIRSEQLSRISAYSCLFSVVHRLLNVVFLLLD
jgi:hypothetical protein